MSQRVLVDHERRDYANVCWKPGSSTDNSNLPARDSRRRELSGDDIPRHWQYSHEDFYDISELSEEHAFDGDTLASAIGATFARRGTPLPVAPPVALTRVFGDDAMKQTQ